MRSSAQRRLTAVGRVAARVVAACSRSVGSAAEAEAQAIGGGGADQGGAADLHGADGVSGLVERVRRTISQRQGSLVWSMMRTDQPS